MDGVVLVKQRYLILQYKNAGLSLHEKHPKGRKLRTMFLARSLNKIDTAHSHGFSRFETTPAIHYVRELRHSAHY